MQLYVNPSSSYSLTLTIITATQESFARQNDHRAQSAMGDGYHLQPNSFRLRLNKLDRSVIGSYSSMHRALCPDTVHAL